MTRDDTALLELARSGDTRAMDQLLARHERQVYRFGLRMCGTEDAARDVLQQTLLTAFKGLHHFRGDAALSTWLYQIARSFCIKSRRRRVDEPDETVDIESAAARAVPAENPDPEAVTHAHEIGAALQAAILALPGHYREVLILRDVEGLSAEEASKVVGIEVPALKSRLHRARMELRAHLGSILDAQPDAQACPELAQQLSEYAAEEIDQATCTEIERHLSTCPRCAAACDALKRTVSLCRSIPGDEVPLPVRTAVRQVLVQLARPTE